MKIPIKAKVFCRDEHCGHIGCVVINPMNDEVTHIVIEDDHYPYEERIIPVDLVEKTTADSVHLACKREELLKMDDFIEHRYIHVDKVHNLYPARRHVYLPYGWPINENFADIPHIRIPSGELAIHRGAIVEAVDGHAGKVDQFLIEPTSGHITHLIMREGHHWGQKEVTIPISEVDHVDDDLVYLKLKKADIGKLPTIPTHQWF
jgi:sporulation protein YlmC with PRC-barrel domain